MFRPLHDLAFKHMVDVRFKPLSHTLFSFVVFLFLNFFFSCSFLLLFCSFVASPFLRIFYAAGPWIGAQRVEGAFVAFRVDGMKNNSPSK